MVSLLPMSWNGREFGRIQKAAAAHAVHRQEIAELRIAEAEPSRSARRAERSVGGVDIAEQPRRAQARSAW